MVRSGWVSRRRRAGSPTTMLPSGSRLTTDGHNVLPCGPTIHRGCSVAGSTQATRLYVVPRSIPTMRPMLPLSPRELFLDVGHQIPDVRTAIQDFIDLREMRAAPFIIADGIRAALARR